MKSKYHKRAYSLPLFNKKQHEKMLKKGAKGRKIKSYSVFPDMEDEKIEETLPEQSLQHQREINSF